MILKVFLLFLLNHVVFDFIFQGKSIIKKRFPKELDLNNKKSTMKKLKVNYIDLMLYPYCQNRVPYSHLLPEL